MVKKLRKQIMKYAELKTNNFIIGNVHAFVRYETEACLKNNGLNQSRRADKNGFLATLTNIKILYLEQNEKHYKKSTLGNSRYKKFRDDITKKLENEVFATPSSVIKRNQQFNNTEIKYYNFLNDDEAIEYFGV